MRSVIALLLALSSFAMAQNAPRRAPGFSLADTKGTLYDLQDFRGKFVLVEFMQTSCHHCAEFAKILEQARAKYGDRLAILSIVNPPSDANSVNKFITDNGVKTPILWDCGQVAFSYIRPKTAKGLPIPQVFVVDPQGMIVKSYVYGNDTIPIFEGKAFIPELDKLMAGPAKR
jgi:peroxiredoxin